MYYSRQNLRNLVISPRKVVFILDRWHVRGLEHGDGGKFKDFVISRVHEADKVKVEYSARIDTEWMQSVHLQFEINPALSVPLKEMLNLEWRLGPSGLRDIVVPRPCAMYVVRALCRQMFNGQTRWVPANGAAKQLVVEMLTRSIQIRQ